MRRFRLMLGIHPESIVKLGFGDGEMAARSGAFHINGSAIEIDEPEDCGPSALGARPAVWVYCAYVYVHTPKELDK